MTDPNPFVRKLAQDPRNRVIKVAWAGLGGMLLLQASWLGRSKTRLPVGSAIVTDLPDLFPDLDIFGPSSPEQMIDPTISLIKNNSTTAEPITDAALEKFMYWTPAYPIKKEDTRPAQDTIVYYGTMGPEWDKDNAFLPPFPGARDQCGQLLNNLGMTGTTYLHCNDQALDWIHTHGFPDVNANDTYTGDRGRVERAAAAINAYSAFRHMPDTMHVAALNLGNSGPEFTREDYGVVIINVNKLKKFAPRLPNGKAPQTYTFLVNANSDDVKGTSWEVNAFLISSKLPPKGTGVRRFNFDSSTLFPGTVSPDASAQFSQPKSAARVEVTVDFKEFTVTFLKLGGETVPTQG